MSHNTPEHSGYRDTITGKQESAIPGYNVDGTKRKSAGEWTAERCEEIVREKGWRALADMVNDHINAALDAERKKTEDHAQGEKAYCEAFDKASATIKQLREQLAAEQENLKTANEHFSATSKAWAESVRQLAAERENWKKNWLQWCKEADELRQQLAAERERVDDIRVEEALVSESNRQLREQLAAERRKNNDWRNTERRVAKERDAAVDALKRISNQGGIGGEIATDALPSLPRLEGNDRRQGNQRH